MPTEEFLNCSAAFFGLLIESFNSTAFIPVKMDVFGNINVLKKKFPILIDEFILKNTFDII